MKNLGPGEGRLRRDLRLVDVFAISTGAMFSSGLFLLPGLAFGLSGAWLALAYVVSAVLVLPAMLSKAELASALPRAGGTYYFLDRSMGPLVGTVGGLGTWFAMGLKNTFALIGLGAYAALFFRVDMTLVALCGTVLFGAVNIMGVKETARLQRYLVYALLLILSVLVVASLGTIGQTGFIQTTAAQFKAAPGSGLDGFLATVGLVFVSYAGLTKVAGVAEEVERPDRNILVGMSLSLVTAVLFYGSVSFLVVVVIDHQALATDLTPIASLAEQTMSWMPGRTGVFVIFLAALAAFASTANAGILAASRYLLAMGRDDLIHRRFAEVGRFSTPTLSVVTTCALIIVALLTLDVVSVAKLASAFQLLMFAFVNLAVVVMRESRIESYDPPVKSPFYPWMQLLGAFLCLAMIVELGRMAMIFTLGIVAVGVLWYFLYVQRRVQRSGAILHWFERLGRGRSEALEREIWSLMKETGTPEHQNYTDMLARAVVLEVDGGLSFGQVAEMAAENLAERVPIEAAEIAAEFTLGVRAGLVPVTHDIALPHFRVVGLALHELVIVRAKEGVRVEVGEDHPSGKQALDPPALFFLLSPDEHPGQHLRILAELATRAEHPEFRADWLRAATPEALRGFLGGQRLEEVEQATDREQPGRGGRMQRILVVDPGDPKAAVIAQAKALAADGRAHVTLVAFESEGGSQSSLASSAEQLRGAFQVEARLLKGVPTRQLVREVVEGRPDVVLLGTSPTPELAPGELAEHLLRKCHCSVWLVPPRSGPLRSVLAAIDIDLEDSHHRNLNARVLDLGLDLTEPPGARLHIAHAWHLVGQDLLLSRGVPNHQVHEIAEEWAAGQRRVLVETVREHGQSLEGSSRDALAKAQLHLLDGEAEVAIPKLAKEQGIDLIVIGSVGRAGVLRFLLPNTADLVLREVDCAVLVVKPGT